MKQSISFEDQALQILRDNTCTRSQNAKTISYITPSKDFYIHQWFWDSCTHAMGLVYVDSQLAIDEVESLFHAQWDNGFIPHIIFNPSETHYFPGASYWGTDSLSPKGMYTSGLIQPPLLAISMHHMDQVLPESAYIDRHIDNLIRYHMFLKQSRDREDSGLITIIHPWESGTDNSPRWDSVLENIPLSDISKRSITHVNTSRTDIVVGERSHRPSNVDYYRYMYLITVYKDFGWDNKKILDSTPFAVKDTLVNTIWAKANYALATMLNKRNRQKEATIFSNYADATVKTLQKCWDEKNKTYVLHDVSKGKNKAFTSDTIAQFMPLFAHIPTESQLKTLLEKLTNAKTYWAKNPVASASIASPLFENTRYWRGPTWPITNVFIVEGLLSYKKKPICQELAKKLLSKTIEMIEQKGFYEYYDPLDKKGTGIGFGNFSWTAALYLYLKNRYATINE